MSFVRQKLKNIQESNIRLEKRYLSEQGYGSLVNLNGQTTTGDTQQQKTTTSDKIKIYQDPNESKLYGEYPLGDITGDANNIVINLGSMSLTTNCRDIESGKTNLSYTKDKKTTPYYSKDLQIKTGQKFNCKFPGT